MYLLVARDKGSEWRALGELAAAGTLPSLVLIEAVCEPLVGQNGKPGSAPDSIVMAIAVRSASLGRGAQVAVDVDNLLRQLSPSDAALLVPLLGYFFGMVVCIPRPAVRTTSPEPILSAAVELAHRTGSGLTLRVDGVHRFGADAQRANDIVRECGLAADRIDLVVDAKDLPSVVSIVEMHDSLTAAPFCRSWTVLAGTFPRSITHLSPETLLHRLERREWISYRDQLEEDGARIRLPWFGDYAAQGAVYEPAPPFRPSPSVRYTTADGFLVLRGKRDDPQGHSQHIGHARVLQSLPEFGDIASGWTEEYVRRIAAGSNGTGNGTTWRVASIRRHVSVATSQSASLRIALGAGL
jgi:hypothetical protein